MIGFISSAVKLHTINQNDLLAGVSDALSHRRLLQCVLLRESKIDVDVDCEQEKDFSKLLEKYAQIVSAIIVNILFLNHQCNHLEVKVTQDPCKQIIRQALVDNFGLKVTNSHEEHSLNAVVEEFFKYFRVIEYFRDEQTTKKKGEPRSDRSTD